MEADMVEADTDTDQEEEDGGVLDGDIDIDHHLDMEDADGIIRGIGLADYVKMVAQILAIINGAANIPDADRVIVGLRQTVMVADIRL
jgi:hypothetical protein